MSETPRRGRIRRFRIPLIIAGSLVGAVLVAFLVVSIVFDDSTTPIPVAEAVDNFDGVDGDSGSSAMLPETGVYSYATEGRESIKTLLTSTHDYPVESAITVTQADCGVRMEWTPLKERSEFLEICRSDGGLVLVRYGGVHEFFGQRDDRFVTCPDRTWLIPPAGVDLVPGIRCEGEAMAHTRTTTIVGPATVTIEGTQVQGTEIRTEIVTSGESTGTTTSTMIIGDTGLLLQWQEVVVGFSDSIIGKAEYNEQFVLTLSSLTPAR